jgi:hypothetical protein
MSNNTEISRIRERLAKLLRLGENAAATPGEIDNALRMAGEMMAKHQITRDDIDLDAVDPVARVAMGRHNVFYKGSRKTTWEVWLLNFVKELIGSVDSYSERVPLKRNGIPVTDEYGSRVYGAAICFYGSADDAEEACAMFEEIRDDIARMGILNYGGWARGDGAAYCEEFAKALLYKSRAEKRTLINSNEQTGALILAGDKSALAIVSKAKNWLKTECKVSLSSGGSMGGSRSGSGDARGAGRRDGNAYNASRPGALRKIA